MINTRSALIQALENYKSDYSEELRSRERFLQLLSHPRSFFRDHLPGHITGSAWIIDETGKFTLLVHHAKLKRWLQPGGHADGDENIINVAVREGEEETGLKSLQPLHSSIFDIDIHPIPARPEFPQHEHYDIRFLFRASKDETLILTNESNDLAWKNREQLPALTGNDPSIGRMANKVKSLF